MYDREVGRYVRVSTSAQASLTGNLSLLGIQVAAVLTAQAVQLFEGVGTSVPIIGTMTMAANTFFRFPVLLSGGLTYKVTNEDVDLTIYYNPEPRT